MIENRKMIGFFITSNVEYFLFKFPFFRGWVDCQTIVWTKITYKKSLVTWQTIIKQNTHCNLTFKYSGIIKTETKKKKNNHKNKQNEQQFRKDPTDARRINTEHG